MHSSTNTDEIKEAIEQLGHSFQYIEHQTKSDQDTFTDILHLKPNANNKEIYKTQYFLQCRVVIEAPLPRRKIPQCANCQQYGPIKKFCHRRPRCVKCAGEHQIMLEKGEIRQCDMCSL